MANRRMFSTEVVKTDRFLDMPCSAQSLYFHLGMDADDEGFVSAPRRIMRTVGSAEDDLKLLIAKGFIIPFDSGVCVIKEWRQNNYLRNDRFRPSVYTEERKNLVILDNNSYALIGQNECLNTTGIPSVNQLGDEWSAQDSIVENSIVEDSIDSCLEPEEPAPSISGILIPLNDKTFYDVPVKNIKLWEDAYPAVDVQQELRRMVAWSDSNPKKKKTRGGVTRFINNWLAKKQDAGGSKNTSSNQDGLEDWINGRS